MRTAEGAAPFVPPTKSLARLAAAVQECRGCDFLTLVRVLRAAARAARREADVA